MLRFLTLLKLRTTQAALMLRYVLLLKPLVSQIYQITHTILRTTQAALPVKFINKTNICILVLNKKGD